MEITTRQVRRYQKALIKIIRSVGKLARCQVK
jgi:hypothetical protein